MKKTIILIILSMLCLESNAIIFIETDKYSLENKEFKKIVKHNPSEDSAVYEPFLRIYLGGFHAYSQKSIILNSSTGKGTRIDPEEALGHEEKSIMPRVEVILTLGKRHEIGFTYWTIRRTHTKELEKNIQFNDTVFYANTPVASIFNFTNYAATYRYSVFKHEYWNAGVSIGGKLLDVNTKLTANLNGNSYFSRKRIYAPLPLFGLHGTLNSGKHFLIKGTVEYLKINMSDLNYRTIDLRAGIEFYPIKNVGIGTDYHFFDTFIKEIPSGKLNGELTYNFNAFSIYLALRI